jgi:hypothetical protein
MSRASWKCGWRVASSILVVCLASALTHLASAQDAPTTTPSQAEINKQLLDRISELEAEIKQLKTNSQAPSPAPAPPPQVEVPRPHVVAERLKFQVFGDLGAQGSTEKASSGEAKATNSFQVGSFDLFMTSRLSDKVSVLGELVVLPFSDNVVETDLERLELQYRFSERFNVGVGRYHTSIGYYNTAYHHGLFFQTPIGRPLMFSWDDDGGFLPLQEIGVTTSGKIPSGNLGLKYVAEVGNGRAHAFDVEPAQNRTDNNNAKSFNLALTADPGRISGLHLGFSFYHDYINPTAPPNISQSIMVASVIYQNSNYEFMNEVLLLRDTELGGRTFHLPAFYSQFSRRIGNYRPYVRYAYENANDADRLYNGSDGNNAVGRQGNLSLGVRREIAEFAAIKLQYDRIGERGEDSFNKVATQFAFTF